MTKSKIKIGRTVAVYGGSDGGHYYRGNRGLVMHETGADEINIQFPDGSWDTVHPKQCRLIASIPAKCVCGVK